MKVEFTVDSFPASGNLKKSCGLPFGLAVAPLADNSQLVYQRFPEYTHPKQIPRCSRCYAYVNVYCRLQDKNWTCALCGSKNRFFADLHANFLDIGLDRCPLVLSSDVVDLHLHEPPFEDEEQEDTPHRWIPEGYPIFLALIDTYCEEERLECMKRAIVAALDVLPQEALIGIVSFGDRLTVHDVKGTIPCRRSVAILDGVPLVISLEDVLPLERLLAPIGQHKSMIVQSLENIEASIDSDIQQSSIRAPTQAAVSRSDEEAISKGQAFGTVLQAVLEYLHSLEGEKEEQDVKRSSVLNARVLCFLAGPPTIGIGNLSAYISMKARQQSHHDAKAQKDFHNLKKSVSEFYDQTALVAASLGIVLDLFLLPSRPLHLDILSSLATHSGGNMWMYEALNQETLTQDLCRHLSIQPAQGCLMRVRLPSQLKISKAYGRLMKDPLYDDVYHVLSCDGHETFCLDVEFDEALSLSATLQVVFQYALPVFLRSEGKKSVFVLQRRMRIVTVQKRVSDVPKELYSATATDVVTKFLMHKVMVAVEAEGVLKAAVLLQDWLIILAASFAKWVPDAKKPFVAEGDFDRLIRSVYGLLRSPLLLGRYHRSNEDREIVMRHLWSSLRPSDLGAAVYPNLMSFSTVHDQAVEHLPLSRVQLQSSKGCLLLLDTFDILAVFSGDTSEDTFHPPASSPIDQVIDRIKRNRKRVPYYFTVRENDLGSKIFFDRLVDEPVALDRPLEGENGIVFEGYLSFVDWIKMAADNYRLV